MSSNGTVLVVDDDPDVLRAARVALSSHVERVALARETSAIESLIANEKPDAVLLDMNFVSGERSGRAGLNALSRIRVCDPHLSVVLMTAYGGVTLAVESLKHGAVDFVLKPWRNDKLVEAVRAAIDLTCARRGSDTLDLEALERAAIERALARHHGNISLAASTLGLSRAALYRRKSKHGL
jgi:DNA-binding NtrC family response regulator